MKGYTLIEMMITLSIVGILVGFGTPSLQEFHKRKTLEAERERLTVTMAFARTHSITEQVYVIVCPSLSGQGCDNQSNWHQGWIVFEDYNQNRQLDDRDKLLRHDNSVMSGVTAKSSIYRQKIRFNELGFSPGTNVSINFCDTKGLAKPISLIINNVGRVRQSPPLHQSVCS